MRWHKGSNTPFVTNVVVDEERLGSVHGDHCCGKPEMSEFTGNICQGIGLVTEKWWGKLFIANCMFWAAALCVC